MSHDTERLIPALFATIHHRSEERPNGYTPADISWLNVIANEHIPSLHADLLEQHRRRYPDDVRAKP
jgi:hypothetical protein